MAKVALVYLALRWLIVHLVRRVVDPMAAMEKDPVRARRVKTLNSILTSALLYTLGAVAGIMALRATGVDPVPLVTAAGVAGLAVGFGAQKLVRDVIGGFFILLEDQFAVGETVTVAGVTGTVCDVGLRTTRLRDAEGKLFIFSNGDITTVCNHSRGELTVPLEVSVAPSADLKRASEIIDGIGQEVSARFGLSGAFQSQGVKAFDAAKVTLKVVGSVPPQKKEQVLQELRESILQRFQKEGIPIV